MLLLTLIVMNISYAQEKLTFEDAVKIALENNFDIKMIENDAEIIKNQATVGNAGLLPTVDVSAGASYTNGVNANVGREIELTNVNAGLGMTYTIFDGMGRFNTYKKLKQSSDVAELRERADIESVILQLSNEFYNLAVADENLKIAKEGLEISKERYLRAKTKFEFGKTRKVDVLQAEVDLNTDSLTMVDASNNLASAKRNMNVLLGRESNLNFNIAIDGVDFAKLELQVIKEDALERNASYLEAVSDMDVKELDLKITQASLFPKLSFSANYSLQQVEQDQFALNFDDPKGTVATGLTLSYNIFDGGKRNIERQNAKIALENSRLQKESFELMLIRDIENGYANYQNSLLKVSIQENSLNVAELNFQQVEERYNLGQMTATEFREAQLNLLQSKSNLYTSIYEAKLTEIELYRLRGTLLN